MSFFFDASYFRWRTSFFGLVHLWRPITPVQNLTRPISSTFSETSGREVSHGPSPDIFFFEQISRNEHFWKKLIFNIFSLPHQKKNQTILIRPILKFDALPIAHFETYVPLFLKHLWKLAISLKLWVPAHFEVGWSRTVAAKIGVFRPFFLRKSFFWLISTQWTPQSVIHGWKATDLHLMMVKRKNYFSHPVKRQIFVDAPGQTFYMTWDCVIIRNCKTFDGVRSKLKASK